MIQLICFALGSTAALACRFLCLATIFKGTSEYGQWTTSNSFNSLLIFNMCKGDNKKIPAWLSGKYCEMDNFAANILTFSLPELTPTHQ